MAAPTKSVAAVLHELADEVGDLTFKNMFGWRCTFYQGKMQAGYQGEQVMLRLSKEDRTEFLKLYDAEPFNPKGDRPMKAYVSVPANIVHSEVFTGWFEKSLQYVAGLPPREKRGRSKKHSA